jgi:5-methylcytosine-specific restriction endonuclease McrA
MIGVRKQHQRHSQKVTRTARWKVLRMAILERDGFRCTSCVCAGRLEVDHIKPVRTRPELSYTPGNLQTLCPACHTRKTRIECGHAPLPDDRQQWRGFVTELQHGGKKPKLSMTGELNA